MTPRLTVVVPVYNVEQYLEECLASIAAQTLPDLDVVMVDDGSTDSGPRTAAAWAARDPRFRLVRQDNGGLGRARNTGVAHADPRTAYLAFADSDDVLPPRAYERMVDLLDRSGSDFATGNVWRLTPQGRSQAWQHRGMSRTVRRTHITRDLGLLSDRVAWNKVFRRTFWNRHALAFPEGVLYEDTPLTIPAHFLADAVDVLHEHVYYWRIREGSITRRRTDVRGVRDRIAAVDGVSRFLADPANARFGAYKRDYDRSVLTDDLLYFIEALPMAGPEYHRVFMDRARDYLSRVDPALQAGLPVELRMRWKLIGQGRLADLLTLLEHERTGGRAVFDIAGPPLRKRAVLPRPDGSPVPLPRAATALGAKDLPVTARLREVEWRDGRLVLKGYAYIRNVGARSRLSSLKTAVAMSGRRKLLLPVRTVAVPEVTAEGRQERHCYDWSGFEITVDPRRLRHDGRWQPGQWRIGIVVAAGSLVRPAALRADEAGSGSSPVPYPLDGRTRLVPWYKDGRLQLSVEAVERRVTGHRPGGEGGQRGTVVLDLAVRDRRPPVALRVRQLVTDTVFDYPLTVQPPSAEDGGGNGDGSGDGNGGNSGGDGNGGNSGGDGNGGDGYGDGWSRATAAIRLADLGGARPATDGLPKQVAPDTTATWSAELLFDDGGTARIAVDAPLSPGCYDLGPDARLGGAPRELALDATAAGNLILRDRIPQPLADTVTCPAPGLLRLEGRLRDDGPAVARGHETRAAGRAPGGTAPAPGAGGTAPAPGGTPAAAGAEPACGAAGTDLPCDATPVGAGHVTRASAHLVLRHGTFAAEITALLAPAGDAGRFRVELDVSALPHAGRWYLHLRAGGRDTPVRIARSAMAALPLDLFADGRSLRLDRRFHDHLFVGASDHVPAADRGPYRQRLLRERRYPALARRPLQPAVVYSDFEGRGRGDSPRAVHDELVRRGAPLDHVWVVRDPRVPVPASARAVVYGSRNWYEALARSRYVVTNTHLPAWFRRRDGQRVVQTWHGTPVKRIGLDLDGTLCADLTHMWPQPRRGEQWSVLLSPNTASTAVLRRALQFHGEIAETGLPRTDLLSAHDREKVAEDVRARLGLPAGRTVVLYAPTVRDDESYDAEHHRLHLPLDLPALEAALAPTHVLLLRAHPLVADTLPMAAGTVRGDAVPGDAARGLAGAHPAGAGGLAGAHPAGAGVPAGARTGPASAAAGPQATGSGATGTAAGPHATGSRPAGAAAGPQATGSGAAGAPYAPAAASSGFVRDVSGHPDLAELLLAADVLVTDYCAVMADFAVTGRPILLYTPDLAHYRDTLRGFSFDYEKRAPGPLLGSTAELIDALRDPQAAVRPREEAYSAFRAAFCHLDDGRAAARVADLMLR